jgi:pimeloyl-ACP methyl ester carboxylesterase
VRSSDDVVSGGVVFSARQNSSKDLAILWFHGWGTNFYNPGYVGVGRALADQGFTTVSANTRMHDIANVAKHVGGKRVRGGGYWGVTSEDARDIRAWIDFAEAQGFRRVVLVGHSAGWSSVARYAGDSEDKRISGLILASGNVQNFGGPPNEKMLAEAQRLVEAGKGDELLRLPNDSFASYVSAATLWDQGNTRVESVDFFGAKISNPAVQRIRVPLLGFFGTWERDVGGQQDLDILKDAVQRHTRNTVRVDTAMIDGADHEYLGEEAQVAQLIANWARTLEQTEAK